MSAKAKAPVPVDLTRGDGAHALGDPAFSVQAMTVQIPGHFVLGPIDLTVNAGDHWVVLGPNGSGKTLLLSVMTGRTYPSSGSVAIFGQYFGKCDLRILRRSIGIVSQSVAEDLAHGLTCLDVVITGQDSVVALWRGNFEHVDRNAALELLAKFGCSQLASRRFVDCSQGERQRVLVARALMGDRRVLLLDEASAGVDLAGRETLIKMLDAVAEFSPPITTVQVAHNLEELPACTTHVALMSSGSLLASGAKEETLQSRLVSECFGIPLSLTLDSGRYSARAFRARNR